MLLDFAPCASHIYYSTVQNGIEALPLGRIDPKFPFSYMGATIYPDKRFVEEIPNLKQMCNSGWIARLVDTSTICGWFA